MKEEWYYSKEGERIGPVNETELIAAIDPKTLIWKQGMADWIPASDVEGLLQPDGSGPPPLPPTGDTSIESHLARLQDALIEGKIDKATYEEMKIDVLSIGQQTPGDSSSSEDVEVDPWVTASIHMDGKTGTNVGGTGIDVFVDAERVGQGSDFEGIHLDIETTPGHHSLKLVPTGGSFIEKLGPKKEFVHPLQFSEPGRYTVHIRKPTLSEQFSSPAKIFQSMNGPQFEVTVEKLG